jgi:signal peptidase I
VSDLPPPAESATDLWPAARPEPMPMDPSEKPGAPVPPPAKSRTRRTIIEWGAILAFAVLAAVVLRAFVVQPYFIPSGSMEPTLKVGDKVLVNKLSYHLHGIHRGDVVVFKRPPWDVDTANNVTDLIKRVVGLPGETISASSGHVLINGQVLKEPWLAKGATSYTANFGPVHIPAGRYFVMGDNRPDSSDSRFVLGPIPSSLIVGRAFIIVWPLGHLGSL